MSSLEEFTQSIVKEAKKDNDFKELQDILEKLDSKPKIVYRSYEVISNT